MGLAGKLEMEVHLKGSAEKFYEILNNQVHHIPNVSDKVEAIEVHEGDSETLGSIKLWKFTLDGKPEYIKEKVEYDEANKSITIVAVEGHVLDKYKSYKLNLKAVEKDDKGGLVKITIEYEKLNEDDDAPNKYLDVVIAIIKDIDAHLLE